jgi:hypothetical protein
MARPTRDALRLAAQLPGNVEQVLHLEQLRDVARAIVGLERARGEGRTQVVVTRMWG